MKTTKRKPTTVHVISHTHWDREWYRTNQEFRVELVSVVDDVIEALERQEGFFCFTLDGQAILLEDYLAMRPEQKERVRTLVRGGNLLVGPWYTQPDEFLVSGESLVRNLQAGTQTAALYGGAMRVGWVPDAFGHVAQLPQILRNFDVDCAALTRGIGNELDGAETDFRWESPDGSAVFVAHQVQGYYSGGLLGFPYFWGSVHTHHPSVKLARERLLRLIKPDEREPASHHVALWNGADHLHPEPELANTLDQLEEHMPGYRIIHSSVPEYARGVQRERPSLPVVRGELRGSRYHPLLPSILSSRIHLKQRNAAVQRLLERHTEPVALFASVVAPFAGDASERPRYYYPGHAIRESWKLLLQNHGHDSIGGCSIDQVHREMGPRFDQAEQIAGAVCGIAIREAGNALATDWIPANAPAVVCFTPHDRPGARVIEHTFSWSQPLDERLRVTDKSGAALPSQVLEVEEHRYRWLEQETSARDVVENAWWWAEVLRRMDRMSIHGFRWHDDGSTSRLSLYLADDCSCTDQTVMDLVRTSQERRPESTVLIETRYYRHTILFCAPLPPLSAAAFAISPGTASAPAEPGSKAAMQREELRVRVDNDQLFFNGNRVSVEPDGSISIETSFGTRYRKLVTWHDEGDCGDSYDFSPAADGSVQLAPTRGITVSPGEAGPVRASLVVGFTATIPAGLAEDHTRRSETVVDLPIQYEISVEMGSDRVEVAGTVENHARDHRLRAHFTAPIVTDHIVSDGQFCVEERPVSPPDIDGWVQQITQIRPHQTWVSLADAETGLCVHTDGLHEHEPLPAPDGVHAHLGITLLRCFGWLSRGDLTTRKGQAGPMIETPDAQQQGRNRFRFTFRVVPGEQWMSRTTCTAEPAFLESISTPVAAGQKGLDPQISLISMDGDHLALTALKASIRIPGAAILRLFNTAHHETTQPVRVSRLFDRATRVRLDETPIDDEELEDGVMMVHAGPAEIVTIRLEPAPRHRVTRLWNK